MWMTQPWPGVQMKSILQFMLNNNEWQIAWKFRNNSSTPGMNKGKWIRGGGGTERLRGWPDWSLKPSKIVKHDRPLRQFCNQLHIVNYHCWYFWKSTNTIETLKCQKQPLHIMNLVNTHGVRVQYICTELFLAAAVWLPYTVLDTQWKLR